MSWRTKLIGRQPSRISRFFPKPAAGVTFAYHVARCLLAAVSCAFVGGCIVTSAEEFPEEVQVPPIVLDTPGLPIGTIIAYDMTNDNELRLSITVRDDNLDDELQVHAQTSVLGVSEIMRICAPVPIMPNQQATREQYDFVIPRSSVRPGVCNKLDVYVSREFVGSCTERVGGFNLPQNRGDIGQAGFWIWETSGDPASNPSAAQSIFNTCPVVTRTSMTSMPPQ